MQIIEILRYVAGGIGLIILLFLWIGLIDCIYNDCLDKNKE